MHQNNYRGHYQYIKKVFQGMVVLQLKYVAFINCCIFFLPICPFKALAYRPNLFSTLLSA